MNLLATKATPSHDSIEIHGVKAYRLPPGPLSTSTQWNQNWNFRNNIKFGTGKAPEPKPRQLKATPLIPPRKQNPPVCLSVVCLSSLCLGASLVPPALSLWIYILTRDLQLEPCLPRSLDDCCFSSVSALENSEGEGCHNTRLKKKKKKKKGPGCKRKEAKGVSLWTVCEGKGLRDCRENWGLETETPRGTQGGVLWSCWCVCCLKIVSWVGWGLRGLFEREREGESHFRMLQFSGEHVNELVGKPFCKRISRFSIVTCFDCALSFDDQSFSVFLSSSFELIMYSWLN